MANPEFPETAFTAAPEKSFSISAFNDEINRDGWVKAIQDRPREAGVEAGGIVVIAALAFMTRGGALRGAAQEAVSSEAAAELDSVGQAGLRQAAKIGAKPLELASGSYDLGVAETNRAVAGGNELLGTSGANGEAPALDSVVHRGNFVDTGGISGANGEAPALDSIVHRGNFVDTGGISGANGEAPALDSIVHRGNFGDTGGISRANVEVRITDSVMHGDNHDLLTGANGEVNIVTPESIVDRFRTLRGLQESGYKMPNPWPERLAVDGHGRLVTIQPFRQPGNFTEGHLPTVGRVPIGDYPAPFLKDMHRVGYGPVNFDSILRVLRSQA